MLSLTVMKKIILCLSVLLGFTMSAQIDNTSYGTGALGSIVSGGDYNSAFGKDALLNTTTGDKNTAVGNGSLSANTTGSFNVAIGTDALKINTTGGYNTAVGVEALWKETGGSDNVAVGFKSLTTLTTGNNNTAVGDGAIYTLSTSDNNTGIGYQALYKVTNGSNNTALGTKAAWSLSSGSNNTTIGYEAYTYANNSVNQTIIGYKASGTADNSVVLGNDAVTAVYMAEDAGATVYAAGLNLNSFLITATSTILTLSGDLTINSDERLKDNIQPLGSTLNKLHQIEAKTYSFKKDEEHTPKIGVLAQEVQAVFPELVTEGADGILSVNYQGLVPVLINAINEQE